MRKLMADDGMVYTNGETYGKEICLPDSADASVWRQVNEPIEGESMKYSVVSIIEAMRGLGKYEQFREWLERSRYDWDFIGANYLAENHPTFKEMCAAIVSNKIMTKEQLDEMLPKCVWSAE